MDRPRRLRLNGAMTQTTATPHHDRDLSRDPVLVLAAAVRRLVALSGRGAHTWETGFGQDMLELEDTLRHSGVEGSIVRSSNFAQNFTEDAFHAPVMAGELALPVGGVPDPVVDVDDVVDVVVATLTRTTGSVR